MYGSAADYFVYIGFLGLIIVFIMLAYFIIRRIIWIFGIMFGMSVGSPNYKAGMLKFLTLLFFFAGFMVFTYTSFYERAYPKFEEDKTGAEVSLFPAADYHSAFSINLQRSEKYSTSQGATIENGNYLLLGEILTPPEWLKNLGVSEGFRFYGLIKGSWTSNYIEMPIDVNVSEKPNDIVWRALSAIQDVFPLAGLEKYYVQFSADGFNSKFDVYVSKHGFKRD